jgi:hypothetical protein
MYYTDYAARLMAEYSKVSLEPGCTEIGPQISPTKFA